MSWDASIFPFCLASFIPEGIMRRHFIRSLVLWGITLIISMLLSSNGQCEDFPGKSLQPPLILPDQSEFKIWKDRTEYHKTYFVDRNANNASDDNPGTAEAPFRTISRAAEILQPGERVVIREGVYREFVQPKRGGMGSDAMIAYEALPGHRVVIKGSRILKTQWQPMETSDLPEAGDTVWKTDMPFSLFEGYNLPDPPSDAQGTEWIRFPSAGNPFRRQNASDEDISIMPWAEKWVGKLPYTLPRGLVFQDGQRLTQVARRKNLFDKPGSFYVADQGRTLYVRPLKDAVPDNSVYEVTVQQQLFKPAIRGLGFIKVKGITFEHAGNGFPRTGVGAVFTNGGHHWIIEQNTVRQVNSVGIEIGARTNEFYEEGTREELNAKTGYHIVRGNHVHGCGTGGIQGLIIYRCLVEHNEIHHCGWHDVEQYWETAGIKLLLTEQTVVRKNYLHDISHASGIWLDYQNVHSRVCQNILTRIQSVMGGIFIEASQVPNMVDHNIVWNVSTHGIYQHDSDKLVVANNLCGKCGRAGILMRVCEGRKVGGRISTSHDNVVVNNILIQTPESLWFLDAQNRSAWNFYSNCPKFDLKKWKERGLGATDQPAPIRASLNPRTLEFTWSCDEELPEVPRVPTLTFDILGFPIQGESCAPGPFLDPPTSNPTSYPLNQIFR